MAKTPMIYLIVDSAPDDLSYDVLSAFSSKKDAEDQLTRLKGIAHDSYSYQYAKIIKVKGDLNIWLR